MEGADEIEKQTTARRPHVLVVPHNGQGHMIPLFLFAKELAQKGTRVTFIGYKAEIDRLTSEDRSTTNCAELFQLVPLHRPDVYTTTPWEAANLLWQSFQTANMLEKLSTGSDRVTCIVADMFVYWGVDLGSQLQIPTYTFVPSGAVTARFLQSMDDLFNEGTLREAAHSSELEMFEGKVHIPGLPALRYHELVVSCRVVPLRFKNSARKLLSASGLLINTFYELECSVVDTLRKLSPIKGQKFYPVGPFLQTSKSMAIAHELNSNDECVRWLDCQPENSVVYISFGTAFRLKPMQIKEIALGLERSKHRFLWVLPHPKVRALNDITAMDPKKATPELLPGSADVFPAGFEARIAGRGYIEKSWAPQIQVLSHPSTAGFLTHCGWNSTLEAISFGVSMLAWPISAEQHLNCRYLVDELKVATEVDTGTEGLVVNREEVERAVRLFMDEGRIATRGPTDALKLKAAAARAVGGSSTLALEEFVQDIRNLQSSVSKRSFK